MAKHLDSLQIKNFRMLEDLTVERLGQVNLIVGNNNSGKSTVLEALRIYASNANQNLLEEISYLRGERYISQENGDLEEFYFENFFFGRLLSSDSILTIGSDSDNVQLQLGYLQEIMIDRDVDGIPASVKQLKLFVDRNELSEDSDAQEILVFLKNGKIIDRIRSVKNRRSNSALVRDLRDIPCSFVPTRIINLDELAGDWDKIVFSEHEKVIKDALKIIAPSFLDITFIQDQSRTRVGLGVNRYLSESARSAVVKLVGSKKPIPLGSMGDGMTRVFQIALKIFSAKDGFLLIDEFENGLHYSIQEKVWELIFEMAQRLNIQVFATTHSRDCIEAFSKVANDRADVEGLLFRMGRSAKASDEGKIIATIFDEAKLQRFNNMDMDVR